MIKIVIRKLQTCKTSRLHASSYKIYSYSAVRLADAYGLAGAPVTLVCAAVLSGDETPTITIWDKTTELDLTTQTTLITVSI